MKLLDWIDERTAYRAVVHHLFDEPVLGGARWAYVFGSGLAFLFVTQLVTGVVLALFYSPSTNEAWGSVWFLSNEIPLGWFVRGIHHWTSSAVIVVLVVHLLQVFLYGAYRKPRELAWWTGLTLMAITLGFSLTGYLLPWDQKGYWATRVVTSIVGTFPLAGGILRQTLEGGNDLGNLTLTRFFGFHVFFLPGSLALLLAAHIYLFRRNGVTPRWSRPQESLARKTEPFWPRQVTYDVAFAAVLLAVVVGLTLRHHGASLEAPADPSSNYLPRPEWYFLWLFEMLKVLPGNVEGIGLLAFSIFAGLFLAALPLVDRAADSSPRSRWRHVVVAGALSALMGGLTVLSLVRDARDPAAARHEASALLEARRASALAAKGIPPGGAQYLYMNEPIERGRHLFTQRCTTCHQVGGVGGNSAPDLSGYLAREWVVAFLTDPTTPRFYGATKVNGMDPPDATPAEIGVLADHVLAPTVPSLEPAGGAALFEEKGCAVCHPTDGSAGKGPVLVKFGTDDWIRGALLTPGDPRYYGKDAEMPSFAGKLSAAEVDDLVAFLRDLRSQSSLSLNDTRNGR